MKASLKKSLLLSLTVSSPVLAQEAAQTPVRHAAVSPTPAPTGPTPTLGELMRANGGSLRRAALQMPSDPRALKSSDVNVFAVPEPKPKTFQKHDLITIIVSEQSEYTSDGTTDTKKDVGVDAKLEQFPSINLANLALKNAIGSVTPELKASANRNYKGEGSVDRKDTFTTRIQAEVVDVKPNGNLVLQARSRIVTDEEEQVMILSGICSVKNVTPDNTVLSTQLFEKDVTKKHTGAVRDATKRGWVPRLLDWANPF